MYVYIIPYYVCVYIRRKFIMKDFGSVYVVEYQKEQK